MPALLDGDFKELFKKPPASVLAYFREKGLRGPDSHWDWSDTMRHAHDRAFTVAKATNLDIVRDIRDSLTKAIQDGQSFQSWRRGIVPSLQAKGWWGKQLVVNPQTGEETLSQLGSTRRMETIYRTNMATAYEAGHHSARMEVVEDMPYWRYVARAPGKNRRADHQALHNIVKRWDDPFWASHEPINAFGCQCTTDAMDDSDVQQEFGKPASEVAQSSKPEDFTSKTVIVQGKEVSVTGFRAPNGSVVYPYPGFDYSPGDAAWRAKQMLADKIVDLPAGATRTAYQGAMEKSIADNFTQYIALVEETSVTRGESLAVGILSEENAAKVAGKTLRNKAGREFPNNLGTPLLLASDSKILHAVRESKVAKGIAMPQDMLTQLPDLLKTYQIRWDRQKPGLLFFSEPFQELKSHSSIVVPQWRWKVVFEPDIHANGNRMVFKTATKVRAETLVNSSVPL